MSKLGHTQQIHGRARGVSQSRSESAFRNQMVLSLRSLELAFDWNQITLTHTASVPVRVGRHADCVLGIASGCAAQTSSHPASWQMPQGLRAPGTPPATRCDGRLEQLPPAAAMQATPGTQRHPHKPQRQPSDPGAMPARLRPEQHQHNPGPQRDTRDHHRARVGTGLGTEPDRGRMQYWRFRS